MLKAIINFLKTNWFKITLLFLILAIICATFYFFNEQQKLNKIKQETESKNAQIAHEAELEQQAQQNKLLEEANNLKKQEILRKQVIDSSRSSCLDLARTYYQKGINTIDVFYQNCLVDTVVIDGTTYKTFDNNYCEDTKISRYQDNSKLYNERRNECYVEYPAN